MRTPATTPARLGLCLALCLLPVGCSALDKAPEATRRQTASGVAITEHDARIRLAAAGQNFLASVAGAAREIERKTDDLGIRRFTLVVRLRTLHETQRLLQLEDPRVGALDLWTFAHQVVEYFETGDGRKTLGELSEIAAAAARQQLDAISSSVAALLPDSLYESGQREVQAIAKANPILGETFVRSYRPSEDVRKGEDSIFATIIGLPFKPFSFGSGVGEAAAAIDRFAVQTDKFSSVVSVLPLQMQWNLQYLLLALEDQKSIASAVESANAIARAAETLAETAKDLPDTIGTRVDATIERIERSQGELRTSLDRLRSTATEVKATMAEAKETVASVSEASASLTETAKAWKPTAEAFDRLINPPDDPDEPPDPDPFKMPQVTDAANALTVSAKELQKLVEDLRGLLGPDELPGAISKVDDSARSAVDHTAHRAADLTDHVTWRAVQLVLAILVAAVVYRLVSWRIPRRVRKPAT